MNQLRWQQRFQNYEKSFFFLRSIIEKSSLNPIEEAGLIQAYQLVFELGWKTLKDFLEMKGGQQRFPRDVLKESFEYQLIEDGQVWLDMLEKRNLMLHTYDDKSAQLALTLIKNCYFNQLQKLYVTFKQMSTAE